MNKNEIFEFGYWIFSFIILILSFVPLGMYITIADEFEIQQNIKYCFMTIFTLANLGLSIVSFILNTIDFFHKKFIKATYKTISIILIILSYLLSATFLNEYIKLTNDYKSNPESQSQTDDILSSTITLEKLKELKQNKSNALIYFERADCPKCIAITPDLLDYLDNYGVNYYLYNTLDDRIDNSKKMTEILSLYSVDSVPSLVELNNGEVQEVYEQDALSMLLYPDN